MLPDGLRVAQIVMLLDQAVEQRFLRSATDLLEPQRPQRPQVPVQRRLIDFNRAGGTAPRQRIGIELAYGRQLDESRAVQRQHQPAADHVAWAPIGLYPVPPLTQLLRQSATAQRGMVGNELPDEGHVGVSDRATAIRCWRVHGPQRSKRAIGTQGQLCVFSVSRSHGTPVGRRLGTLRISRGQ